MKIWLYNLGIVWCNCKYRYKNSEMMMMMMMITTIIIIIIIIIIIPVFEGF